MRPRLSGALLAGGLSVIGACERDGAREAAPTSAAASSAAATAGSSAPEASAARADVVPTAASSSAGAPATSHEEAVLAVLRAADVSALARREAPAEYEATLQTPLGPRAAVVWLGTDREPTPRRRALAFSALALELGLDLVSPAVARALPLRSVAALLPPGFDEGEDALRVQNDGTVFAVVATLGTVATGDAWAAPRAARSGFFATLPEREDWTKRAGSPDPVAGDDPRALRAFVGALVLDYLAAHVLRRDVVIAEAAAGGTTLVLADNDAAFQERVDPRALERLLEPLRSVRRFPKHLLERLRALDRRRIDEVFHPGPFEAMLLPPRDRLELDERVKTLRTLIEARVESAGGASVLSL